MKISDITSSQVAAPAKAGTEEPVRSTAPIERISTTQSAKLTETLATVKGQGPSERAAKLAEITKAVRSGQYPVNPQQIAQQIVDDADLDVKLHAMLVKTQ